MNSPTIFSDSQIRREYKIISLLFILGGIAAAIGFLVANLPLITLLVLLVIMTAFAVIIWPESATLVVVFILYTNAAAIAVQFHGVPYIVGASIPLLLVIPLANYLVFKRQKVIINKVLFLVFLFHVIQLIGTVFSRDISLALETFLKYILEGLVLYILITNVVRKKETLRSVTWTLLVAGALIGALGFYQLVTKSYNNNFGGFAQVSNAAFGTGVETIQGEVYQPRLAGSVGEQNRHAQVMLMLVPLGLFLFWGERTKWARILAAILTCLIVLGVATTFSRGAALGFGIVILIMVFMRYIRLYQLAIVFVGLILLLFLLPQYGNRVLRLEGVVGLFSSQEDLTASTAPDGSLEGRATAMLAATLVFADHPIIGVGPGMFPYYYQEYARSVALRWVVGNREAHNLYLGIAADNGILGLLCFLAILFVTLRKVANARKYWKTRNPLYSDISTGYMLSVISYMATGIGLHFAYVRFFWLILGLAVVAGHLAKIESDQDPMIRNKSIKYS
jgi:putative inorganic carbon (HCO3(-)) transporter